MADPLTTITKIINSLPGQLAAGGVLAGIVWKFFKNVGDVLNEKTNGEIARWLRVKRLETGIVADDAVNWPDTFAKVFDRVFGTKHLSWRCFGRSCLASCTIAFLAMTFWSYGVYAPLRSLIEQPSDVLLVMGVLTALVFLINVIPDYISLLETRYLMRIIRNTRNVCLVWLVLFLDFIVTCTIAFVGYSFSLIVFASLPHSQMDMERLMSALRQSPVLFMKVAVAQRPFIIVPAFFTSIWLWLYAGSGFILKAAQRFDLGFGWFISKADIEKKPLQSIGLVAGALVAIVYWTAVIVSRVVG